MKLDTEDIHYVKGNENLKKANDIEHISRDEYKWRLAEIKKCANDILYFAEKYYKIITLDDGKQIIKLYPKQRELIKKIVSDDRVAVLASRQTGKCIFWDTSVRFKHVYTNLQLDMCIGDFHKLLNDKEQFQDDGVKQNNMLKKFIETKRTSEYEVLTDTGWEPVVSSHKTVKYKIWELKTKSTVLKCADRHILFNSEYAEVFVCDLKIGDTIQTKFGLEAITFIKEHCDEDNMYDLELKESSNKRYYTNDILSHNTTAYNIFTLWVALFQIDKSILICANTGNSSVEFVQRIAMAYEELPFWLKPGVVIWNKKELKFSNGSRILGTTTSPAVRGKSCNYLIWDEAAFTDPGIEDAFWEGVYPVISSTKGTKVIMVSTPNGTNNIFYKTYHSAQLAIGGVSEWTNFRIDWQDVPGRDEAWAQQQLASFNYDQKKFDQEFGNVFHGTGNTLIPGKVIQQYTEAYTSKHRDIDYPLIKLLDGTRYPELSERDYSFEEYEKPIKGHSYVLGCDGGEGLGQDYNIIYVIDVSTPKNLKIVAKYSSNKSRSHVFAFCIVSIAIKYNNAFVAIERNGVTKAIVDMIIIVFNYDNIINYKEDLNSKMRQGIYSTNTTKMLGCKNLKDILIDYTVDIPDGALIKEFTAFNVFKTARGSTCRAVAGTHDDCVMAFIWGLFMLHEINTVENFYRVDKTEINVLGIEYPVLLSNYEYERRNTIALESVLYGIDDVKTISSTSDEDVFVGIVV